MTVSRAISLVGTGAALGVFHVLTGPDHLSALATLSANVGCLQAFVLGVRWGIGHSIGLLLVGVVLIFLTLDNDSDTVDVPDGVSIFFESLVGIFMLLLGAYGVRRAWMKRPKVYGSVPDSSEVRNIELGVEPLSVSGHSYDDHMGAQNSEALSVGEGATEYDEPALMAADVETETVEEGTKSSSNCVGRLAERVSAGTMAIFAGIIHGMAGPGGVLGVIPAVQLHNWRLATIYLGCFCISSTLTMGVFGAIYGSISTRLGQGIHREFLIECLSASLSILVGIAWLTLLSIGKLEDVFP